MTQDNPTLTKDDIEVWEKTDLVLISCKDGQGQITKEQILEALEQYPKLKQENEDLKVFNIKYQLEENQKLKAENEELKKKLEGFRSFVKEEFNYP